LTPEGYLVWEGKKYADPQLLVNAFKQKIVPDKNKPYRDWRALRVSSLF